MLEDKDTEIYYASHALCKVYSKPAVKERVDIHVYITHVHTYRSVQIWHSLIHTVWPTDTGRIIR